MQNLLSLSQTASQKIYEETALELIKELSADLIQDRPIDSTFTSMNGLDKCVEEIEYTDDLNNLKTKYHNPKIPLSIRGIERSVNNSFAETMEIVKIGSGDMSIDDIINIIHPIRKELGDKFYGIVLSGIPRKNEKHIMINPLHPIIMQHLISEKPEIDKNKKCWTATLFSFKDDSFEYVKKKYSFAFNYNNYMNEIATILSASSLQTNYITENKNFNVDIVNDKFILNYEEIKTEKKDEKEILENKKRSFIVPGQILNVGGIGYPYYNTIYSTQGLAWNLNPMYAANIAHPYSQSMSDGFEGGSRICTNSGNSKTQKGISSLNHSNLTSPLNSNVFESGSMSYAQQCIDASLSLYLGEKYDISINEKTLTYKEFVKKNNSSISKKDYLKYLKNRISNIKDKNIEPTLPTNIMETTDPIDLNNIQINTNTPVESLNDAEQLQEDWDYVIPMTEDQRQARIELERNLL